MSRTALQAGAILLAVACLSACVGVPAASRPVARQAISVPPARAGRLIGVSVPVGGNPVPSVREFASKTGARMSFVSLYRDWGSPFPATAVAAVTRYGAVTLVNLNSDRLSLASIADGSQDRYLATWAAAARAADVPVLFSFDDEMNGPWWPWGYHRVSASAFVAAWRRVHDVFAAAGASDVSWVWTVNVSTSQTEALAPLWPGAAYVTYVGLHGYFYRQSDTFASVFALTVGQVSELTGDPVLITETGANPASGRVRAIRSLFSGVESAPGVLGFIWFDYDKYAGHDWQIDDDPAALAAFRVAARRWG